MRSTHPRRRRSDTCDADDSAPLGQPISTRHNGHYREELSLRDPRILSWVAKESLRALGYADIADLSPLSDEQAAFDAVLDAGYRAAMLSNDDYHGNGHG